MKPPLCSNRRFCIIGGMMRVLPLVLLCAVVHAAELRIPSVPPPAHFDTESVTNAPLGRALETSRFLRQFDGIVGDRLDLRFFHDGPYCPDIYSRKAGEERMLTAFSSMSNNVDEAVSMIPSVLTNDVRRNAFLSMAGHSGTNVFFRVWEALLDIAETNAVAASPALIDDFRCAATTPLYEYATFHFDLPVCQVLLARTRDLFSTNDPRHLFLVDVISGEEKRRSTEYYLTSGEGLPWFAQ